MIIKKNSDTSLITYYLSRIYPRSVLRMFKGHSMKVSAIRFLSLPKKKNYLLILKQKEAYGKFIVAKDKIKFIIIHCK